MGVAERIVYDQTSNEDHRCCVGYCEGFRGREGEHHRDCAANEGGDGRLPHAELVLMVLALNGRCELVAHNLTSLRCRGARLAVGV